MPRVMRYEANVWCPSVLFYSVSWSSRAAFQESPSQWNVRVCVPVYLVRSSEMQHTKLSALVSTAVLFTKKWKGLGLDEAATFYLYFSLFTSDTWNSPPIFLVCSFRPSPILILFPSILPSRTHTHRCQFSDSYRERWQSECVCRCLSRKWDLGGWMEEFWRRNAIIRKAIEKRMDCYCYGLPPNWVEDERDSFTLPLI